MHGGHCPGSSVNCASGASRTRRINHDTTDNPGPSCRCLRPGPGPRTPLGRCPARGAPAHRRHLAGHPGGRRRRPGPGPLAAVARAGAHQRLPGDGAGQGVAGGRAAPGLAGPRAGRRRRLGGRGRRPRLPPGLPRRAGVPHRAGGGDGQTRLVGARRPGGQGKPGHALAVPADPGGGRRPRLRRHGPGRPRLPPPRRRQGVLAAELPRRLPGPAERLGLLRPPAGRRQPAGLHPRRGHGHGGGAEQAERRGGLALPPARRRPAGARGHGRRRGRRRPPVRGGARQRAGGHRRPRRPAAVALREGRPGHRQLLLPPGAGQPRLLCPGLQLGLRPAGTGPPARRPSR
jgi:hypothetical protein